MDYRATMTLLDVMINVGGITNFAAGNRATITRVSADGNGQTENAVVVRLRKLF